MTIYKLKKKVSKITIASKTMKKKSKTLHKHLQANNITMNYLKRFKIIF